MENSFNNLGISEPILKALEEMGFQTPTEVQSRAIPHVLDKKDLIVMSKTGSGKTAVFGVSMLQMTDPAAEGPQGLILTPVRELAVQVDSDIRRMGKHLAHRTIAVYGQHNIAAEVQVLKKGVTIVTGTPGRVFDHISHGNLITKNIRFLVLDEADRMLDMGFLDQVVRIIRALPKNRVTLLFSATIPAEIRRICSDYMKNPETIEIESQTKTVDTILQEYYRVQPNEKRTQLNRLLLVEQPESCMIFCNTRMAVDHVQNFLTRQGYASEALHGDIPQGKRTKTIQQFKQGEFHILVATDVAARGIHIDNLSLVINYDVPVEKDSYVHRIGRTGRAGNGGKAISLVTGDDIMSLYEIEEHIGVMIPEADLPTEEVFNQRKADAEVWLAANATKAKPAKAPRNSSASTEKGNRKGSTHPKIAKSGEKHKEEKHKDEKQIRHNKTERPDRKKTVDQNKRSTNKAVIEQKYGENTRDRFPPKASGLNKDSSNKQEQTHNKVTGQRKQNTGKAHFDRRDYAAGKSTGVNSQASKPAASQVPAPKVSFLKRLLNNILGK